MIRIGIIGTENSHAMAFSRIINLPNEETGKLNYPDVRVTCVYGPDKESAQKIVDEAGVENHLTCVEDFFGKVDAMMVTSRKGSLHYQYVMPFIEKGIPVFIDKPFTTEWEQAVKIIDTAKKNNVIISGGSGCKLAFDVRVLQNKVKTLAKDNDMITGSISFSIDIDSEHDGFFFYASHLTEMALTAFGYDVRAVSAYQKNKSVIAILRYENYDITLNYTGGTNEYTAVLYSKSRNYVRSIDISLIYEHEVEHFVTMLKTGVMPQSYEDLIKPVAVMNAVVKSIELKREIDI